MTRNKFILLICILIPLNGCATSNNPVLQSQANPTFYQSENKEKSILSIKSALHNDEKNLDLYILLGKEYMRHNNFGDAIDSFNIALNQDPRAFEAFNYRGEAHYLLGNFEQALSDFDMSLTINPFYSDAYYSRAKYYDGINKSKLALGDLDSAIKYNNKKFLSLPDARKN